MKKIFAVLMVLCLFLVACGNTQVKGDGLSDAESPVKGEMIAEQETQSDASAADTGAEMPENGMGEMPMQDMMNEMPMNDMPMHSDVKEFKMTAKQFAFEPGVVEINKGDRVRLIVTAEDVPHGIAIPEYGINERLSVGEPVTIEFTADKEGTFTAFCSVACGSGHSSMKGSIVVK